MPCLLVPTGAAPQRGHSTREVPFRGVSLHVPDGWRVVNLATNPHACLRLDLPSVYVGSPGDQAGCPARLIGGAPAVLIEALTESAQRSVAGRAVAVSGQAEVRSVRLPRGGPVAVVMPRAGVLMTLMYGVSDTSTMRRMLATTELDVDGLSQPIGGLQQAEAEAEADAGPGVSVPGDYRGLGFDTCAAPSQAVMDVWRKSSGYGSLGIYIGGVNIGCLQPNLNAAWVSRQVSRGWHLLPIYVGHQAPCSNLANRFSYDVPTARRQGQADAANAMAMARRRDIAAPSTLYSDVEGYDSSDRRCVAAVMSYLSGWTFALHGRAYQAGA